MREESKWTYGRLPCSIHLGKGIIERDIKRTIPEKDVTLVLYCGGGPRLVLAAESLQKMGYTSAACMDGGWQNWLGAGYPTADDLGPGVKAGEKKFSLLRLCFEGRYNKPSGAKDIQRREVQQWMDY